MGNTGHKMLGKKLKLRENRYKRLKVVRKIVLHLFAYSRAIFALPESLFIDYSGAKCAYFALEIATAQESLFRAVENRKFLNRLRDDHLEKSGDIGISRSLPPFLTAITHLNRVKRLRS